MQMHFALFRTAALVALASACTFAQNDPNRKDWIQAFNGKNLDGWVMKITGYPLGENYGNTFRVEDGLLKVRYDQYPEFASKFGHIFYKTKFSYYRVAAEYRFVGEQAKNGPAWAFRNNGIMVHCQAPETMGKDQDFPISVEVQLLGGGPTGDRPTANVCTPGTEVFVNGAMLKPHCLNSKSPTFRGDQWVRVEAEILGSEKVRQYANGELVLEYENLQIGGGSVSHYDPAVKKDGTPLSEGYIALQGESAPTDFRKVEILNLSGCMDKSASNYKTYYVHRDDSTCVYPGKRK